MTNVDRIIALPPFSLDAHACDWVRATHADMALREKLAQLQVPMLLDRSADKIASMAGQGLGGIFLFHDTTEELRGIAAQFQAKAQVPMLVAGDIEFGEIASIDGVDFTNQMGVAAAGRVENAQRMGTAAGRAGRRAGFNWIYAPVVDLDFNPMSSIVNTRSFGSDPKRVTAMARAYVAACQQAGVAACAKHWPGDGVDYRDQHLTTSVNSLPMEKWRATFGLVFRAMIAAGVKTIMSAHITLPAYDVERGLAAASMPASLSGRLTTDLLRGDFGFNGVIVTDATTMAGYAAHGERGATLPMSIEAGCDMVLFSPQEELDIIHLERAAQDGRLSPARIDEAVVRVLALKASLGLHKDRALAPVVETERLDERSWASEVAAASVTLVRDEQDLLPLSPEKHHRVLLIEQSVRPGFFHPNPPLIVGELLEAAGFEVSRFDAQTPVDRDLFDVILYAVGEEAAMCKGSLRLDWKALHKSPIRSMERYWNVLPTMFLSLGNPYHLTDAPECRTVVNAYSSVVSAQRAAVDALTGKIGFLGQSPVDPQAGLPVGQKHPCPFREA